MPLLSCNMGDYWTIYSPWYAHFSLPLADHIGCPWPLHPWWVQQSDSHLIVWSADFYYTSMQHCIHIWDIVCNYNNEVPSKLHMQIKSLMGTKVEWLYYILQAFNSGDLVRYRELCLVHKAALSSQPALLENEKKLLEKINILCLMEIIFR